jgi:proline iminopeptidase
MVIGGPLFDHHMSLARARNALQRPVQTQPFGSRLTRVIFPLVTSQENSPALARYLAFRRSLPPRPPLERRAVRVRGIDFAVYLTPAVSDAPPLLCVNGGLLFDHKLLWPALAPLASSRQLIFYDQRGRGESGVPPGMQASRIEFDGGDIPALRTALGIRQWDVLGHSWGGGIAMLGAASEAELQRSAASDTAHATPAIRRLVLVNAVGVSSEWLPPLHDAGLARVSGAARDRLAALDPARLTVPDLSYHAEYAQAFFPAWFADQQFAANVNAPLGTSATGAVIAARLRRDGYDWRAHLDANLGANLRDVAPPTLVVHGAADVLPLSEAQRTAALLGQAQVVPIDDAGHNPFWEAPDAFFAAVQAFLAGAPLP